MVSDGLPVIVENSDDNICLGAEGIGYVISVCPLTIAQRFNAGTWMIKETSPAGDERNAFCLRHHFFRPSPGLCRVWAVKNPALKTLGHCQQSQSLSVDLNVVRTTLCGLSLTPR